MNKPQSNWIQINALRLLLVGMISLFLVLAWYWLESVVTYANWRATLNSPTFNLLWEFAYHKGRFYLSAPEQGKSWIFTGGQLATFKNKYWLAAIASLATALLCIATFLFFAILKRYMQIWDFCKRLLDYRQFLPLSWRGVCIVSLVLLFILSVFPIEDFAYWWQSFRFMQPMPNLASLNFLIHDLMTEGIVLASHNLFYACLFTLPLFFVELTGISCLLPLLLNYLPVKGIFRKINLTNIIKPWQHSLGLYLLIGLAFILALLPYFQKQHPNLYTPEAIAQIFQAKIFQQGKISLPIQYSKEFFQFPFISSEDAWQGQFSPGYPLLLLTGLLFNAYWLLNPILSALNVALIYYLTERLYDRNTAALSALLLALSPIFLKAVGSGVSHPATALFFTLGLLFYQNLVNKPNWLSALSAGLFWGISFLINPQITLFALVPFLPYLVIKGVKDNRSLYKEILCLLAPLFLGIFAMIAYNRALTGQSLVFGYNESYLAGFWQLLNPFIPNLFHAAYRLKQINLQLMGRFLPAFIFIFTVPVWNKGRKLWDTLLSVSLFSALFAYIVYYPNEANFSNSMIGLTPILIILSARGLLLFPVMLEKWSINRERTDCLIALLLLVNFGLNLNTYLLPKTSGQINVAAIAQQRGITKALVFLKDTDFPQGLMNNSPLLNNNVVYARDLGKYNYKLAQEFPGRKLYLYMPDQGEGQEFVEFIP